MRAINKLSKIMLLKNSENLKEDLCSKSQKLFSEFNLVKFQNGFYTLLPIMVKSLRKLENLIRKEMEDISANEVLLPSVTDLKLIEKSGRNNFTELFKLTDNHKNFVLNPTCEASITNLMSSYYFVNESHLPYRFYQISAKFRNEKRAKSGLLRSKEFLMKDLYTFDSDLKHCQDTYEEITKKYHDFFQKLKLPYVYVKGSKEDIKNLLSHEFHLISDAGENVLIFCENCGNKENKNEDEKNENCQKCSSTNIKLYKGIEVAHCFHLGISYSEPLNANYKKQDGFKSLLYMNSFGIGITRLLAASVEILNQNKQIRWPTLIAPYLLCIIPPKMGSKEEIGSGNLTELIYYKLKEFLQDDLVVDDRLSLTVGNRLHFVKSLGIPYIIVLGKKILEDLPLIEVHDVNENSVDFVQINEISQFVRQKISGQLNSFNDKKEFLSV